MYVYGQKRSFEVSATKMLVRSETLDAAGVRTELQTAGANRDAEVYDVSKRLTMPFVNLKLNKII